MDVHILGFNCTVLYTAPIQALVYKALTILNFCCDKIKV